VRSEDADQIAELLRNFEVIVRTSRQLGLITIAGIRERVARAEQAVREIEKLTMRTPASVAKDIDLTVHFLGIVDKETAAVPPALREVVAELKKTFPFPGYELMETVALRARVGQAARVEGLLPQELSGQVPPKKYDLRVQVAGIEPRESTSQIRFEHIQATIRFPLPTAPGQPNSYYFESAEISTALEVPDGKTVVVGKAGSTGDSKGYLLVLTAKVVN
jgi:hypothetical protein